MRDVPLGHERQQGVERLLGDAARALDELAVIAPAEDCEQARGVARARGARFAPLDSLDDRPGVIEQLLVRAA